MKITFHKKFKKSYRKQPVKIQRRFQNQLEVFCLDPYDPTFNNHALSGALEPYRSIYITGDVEREKYKKLFHISEPRSQQACLLEIFARAMKWLMMRSSF